MKRYLLLVFTLVSALAIFAETNIQREFLGLTVGKSTASEVQSAMKSRGFELLNTENVSNVGSQFQFKGYYKHQGVEFHTIVTSFLNDTLFVFCAQDSCGEKVTETANVLQKNLEVLYGNLAPADSTFLFRFLKDSADHYGVKTWSRMDDHTMIISMQSEEPIVIKNKYSFDDIKSFYQKICNDKLYPQTPDFLSKICNDIVSNSAKNLVALDDLIESSKLLKNDKEQDKINVNMKIPKINPLSNIGKTSKNEINVPSTVEENIKEE